MSARVLTSLPAMLAAVAIAACSADHAPSRVIAPNAPFLARLPSGGTPHKAEAERVEICKSYLMRSGANPPPTTSFKVTVAGHGSGTVNVPTGGCLEVVLFGGNVAAVTIVETVPSGFSPSYIQTTNIGGAEQPPVGPVSSNTANGYVGGTGGPYGASTGELFEFTNTEIITNRGCTYTQGYWKTHSSKGPAPYDNRWLNLGPLGEDTPFFVSGKTWYQVYQTSPKKGNANYILAHQYMAAKLNILAGASSTSAVDAAIAGAEAYYSGITDLDVLPVDPTRSQLLAWAGTMDDYNNGRSGPGHCP